MISSGAALPCEIDIKAYRQLEIVDKDKDPTSMTEIGFTVPECHTAAILGSRNVNLDCA